MQKLWLLQSFYTGFPFAFVQTKYNTENITFDAKMWNDQVTRRK